MTELREMRKMEEAMLPQNGTGRQAEGAKTPQYLVTLAATMLVFSAGAVIGWSAPALPILEDENSSLSVHVTSDQSSWIGSLLAIGAFIGALPAGSMADKLGRKMSMLLLAAPLLVSWGLIFIASSVMVLYMARLIAGIGLGAVCTIVPMYIAEIAEDSVRGTLGSGFPLMICAGVCFTYCLGASLSYNGIIFVCAICIVVTFICILGIPETPLCLLKQGEQAKAEMSLRKLRGDDYDVYSELQALKDEIAERGKSDTSFMEVASTRQGKRALVISMGLMAGQQLSGINIVIFFAGSIFADSGSTIDPAMAVILIGLSQIVVGLCNLVLIEKAGRKSLLQASALFMTFTLACLGYYFFKRERGDDLSSIGSMPMVSIIGYILAFSLGFGPIPWMISSEVLPEEIKSVSISAATGLNWILAFLVTKAFKPILDAIGAAYTYWLLALFCFAAFFFSTYVVIETKGKSLSQIQDELAGHRAVPNKIESPDNVRTLSSSFQLMLCCGILYTYSVGAVASYYSIAIACTIAPVIFVVGFFRAPETPAHLLKQDKRREAEESLVTLRGSQYNTSRELYALQTELQRQSQAQTSFAQAIGRREAKYALVISLGMMVFQQLSGINIVIFYSSKIFDSAGSTLKSELCTILVGLAQVVSTLVSMVLIDRAGRKILLQVSAASMAICLSILGYYFMKKDRGDDVSSMGMVPVAAVIIYILLFAIGFGPIPWMMSGEVMPADIKSVCTGIAVTLNWTLAFLVTFSFQILTSTLGNSGTYFLFAIICVCGLLFSTFVVIETKGKSLQEIQDELAGKRTNRIV